MAILLSIGEAHIRLYSVESTTNYLPAYFIILSFKATTIPFPATHFPILKRAKSLSIFADIHLCMMAIFGVNSAGALFQQRKTKREDNMEAMRKTVEKRAANDGHPEVRHTDSKARFCIIDGKEVIFMIMDDKEVHPTYDVGIWVNTPFFAQALDSLFDVAWKNMKPIK